MKLLVRRIDLSNRPSTRSFTHSWSRHAAHPADHLEHQVGKGSVRIAAALVNPVGGEPGAPSSVSLRRRSTWPAGASPHLKPTCPLPARTPAAGATSMVEVTDGCSWVTATAGPLLIDSCGGPSEEAMRSSLGVALSMRPIKTAVRPRWARCPQGRAWVVGRVIPTEILGLSRRGRGRAPSWIPGVTRDPCGSKGDQSIH